MFVPRCDDIHAALVNAQPTAFVIRMDADGASTACTHLRTQAQFAGVPVFGVATRRDDLAFSELFSWGGDDLIDLECSASLSHRLRHLSPHLHQVAEPCATRTDCVVVAGADPNWRSVMGRAFNRGNYCVRFGSAAAAIVEECSRERVRVVVANDDLPPSGAESALVEARSGGSKTVWIIVAPPKRMASLNESVGALGSVAITDNFSPAGNVVYLTNELVSQRAVDHRDGPRVPYGTTVSFRIAGREADDVGFSYNVSADGLFVRTLAPPESGEEVWLEMWAPRSERRVRLAGTVAWRQPFGPRDDASVPPGFGVKLTDGLSGDLSRWRHGFDALRVQTLGAYDARRCRSGMVA